MDKIHEDKLILYRRIENIVRTIEENEAKTNEAIAAIRQKSESNPTSIGPANDLLRYMYILEQQYQRDSQEQRTKAREDLYEYFEQFRLSDNDAEEENYDDEQQSDQSEGSQQPEIITTPNSQPSTSATQPLIVVSPPYQVPPAMPSPPRSTTVVPPPSQMPPTMPSPPRSTTVVPPSPQLPPAMPSPSRPTTVLPPPSSAQPLPSGKAHTSSVAPATNPNDIKPETLSRYEKLLSEAQQYEKRYTTIDLPRKKQLASLIKSVMNKIRQETFATLTEELFKFLNGQEQTVANQVIRVSSDEERLLCLSMLASLILAQLLGGDLNDMKTKIFLPLVAILSEQPQHKEFTIIFLERLHKRCPYTIPCYPERKPEMNDKQYFEALGYVEKQDGDHRRLETETEFLNRMSGLIRLFCKLLVRGGPPFDKDLSFAWTWCADVANLPPRSNISSVLLRVYLDEAGEVMIRAYPMQFPKIIKYIQTQYLPRLEKVTSADQIARFRLTLDMFKDKI